MLMTNLYKYNINKLNKIILLLLYFNFFSCSFHKSGNQSIMRRISITYNIPVLKPDGVLLNIRDSFEIFYLKDFIMYKLPYMHTQENSKEILSSNVKYKYFGYKKSNFYGFLYDSVNAKVGTKQQIDLFLIQLLGLI